MAGDESATASSMDTTSSVSTSGLESWMHQVRNLSTSGNMAELVLMLSKAVDASLSKVEVSVLVNAMDALDINDHSLALLALLLSASKRDNTNLPLEVLLQRFALFVSECNREHLCFWHVATFELVSVLTSKLVDEKQDVSVALKLTLINLLLTLLPKVQLHSLQLTPIHTEVMRLSLASRYFCSPVLNLLELDYIELMKECCHDNGKPVLLFFYYGGLILTAVKRVERALFCFEVVVTVPSIAVSHIMLEAHKKFLLLSLLVHGYKASFKATLPKYTSHVVEKHFRHLCSPYYDLVSAFCNGSSHGSSNSLQSIADQHSSVFADDNNVGLVKQVLRMHTKANVQRLTRTFVTLTLTEMTSRIGLTSVEEAEKLLVDMIEERRIDAKIDRSNSETKVIRFDTSSHCGYDSVPALKHIEGSVEQCMRLNEQIRSMDEEIQLHPNYVKKMLVVSGALQSQEEEVGGSGRGVSNVQASSASSTANGGAFN